MPGSLRHVLWVRQWRPRHGTDRDADRSFAQYIGAVANSSMDNHGLGTAKTFCISIRSVVAIIS